MVKNNKQRSTRGGRRGKETEREDEGCEEEEVVADDSSCYPSLNM